MHGQRQRIELAGAASYEGWNVSRETKADAGSGQRRLSSEPTRLRSGWAEAGHCDKNGDALNEVETFHVKHHKQERSTSPWDWGFLVGEGPADRTCRSDGHKGSGLFHVKQGRR